VVICGLFFLAAPQIMAFFPGTSVDPEGSTFLLRVMIILVAVAQLRGPFTQILMTANIFRITAIGDLLGFFAYAVGMVLTVQHGYGLVGVAWSFVAQQLMPLIVVVPQAMRRLDRHAVRFVSGNVLKEFFGYSWKLQVSGTLTVLAAQGDALFVGRFAAPQMTAYGTGASFATTLRNIPMNASLPMDANIVTAIGRHGPVGATAEAERIQRLWVRLVAGWVAVGVPAAGFGVVAWLHLGSDLPGQVAAVVLLANGITLLMLVQRYWLNGLGRSRLTLSYDVIGTVVNLSLTFPLILSFGVLGTISATLVAAIVSAVYLTWVGQRRVGSPLPTPWSQVPWLDVVGAGALAAASCWATATFVAGQLVPLGALSLLTIGAAAAPALALYLVRVVGFRRLRGMVAGVVSRRRR
ncbi:MAG: polysaccharide biosynthesis C-terminal domain-containing protein, partial [Propionibacteriaceae bacterium]|nr:polysaccharide biosynthesis C-terminal domain-containing protein [Propionibacteriaceae bacterium]